MITLIGVDKFEERFKIPETTDEKIYSVLDERFVVLESGEVVLSTLHFDGYDKYEFYFYWRDNKNREIEPVYVIDSPLKFIEG
jgi:hypothetical protein